jgi:hypothetical protein
MDFYHTEGLFQLVARSSAFGNITLMVIGFNAIWIWIDTDFNEADALMDAEWPFQLAEQFFCTYFSFEWLIRFLSFRRKHDGFRDAWFCFDSVMVSMMVIETWVMTLVLIALSPSGGSMDMGNGGLLRILRLLRLSRMARMARLLRAMPELLILIKGMMAAVRSVVFTLLLLAIVLYVFGIAFVQLLTGLDAYNKGFRTVPEAMHTLLLRGTLMDEIGSVVRQLSRAHVLYAVVFYFFVLISALTVMNMLIGVLCEVVSAVSATETEGIHVAFMKGQLEKIWADIGASDPDDRTSGEISKDDFHMILESVDACRALDEAGVDALGLVDNIDFIFAGEVEDDDGNLTEKTLSFGDFVTLLLTMRGSNGATVKDIVDLRKYFNTCVKGLRDEIRKLARDVGPGPPLADCFTQKLPPLAAEGWSPGPGLVETYGTTLELWDSSNRGLENYLELHCERAIV